MDPPTYQLLITLTHLLETPNFWLKHQNFARNFLVDDRRLSWRLWRDLIIFFGSFSSSEPRQTFLERVDPLLHLQVFVDEFGPETKHHKLRNVVTSLGSLWDREKVTAKPFSFKLLENAPFIKHNNVNQLFFLNIFLVCPIWLPIFSLFFNYNS